MKTNRIDEEKLLNDLFILLEYSDSFKDFVTGMSIDAFRALWFNMNVRCEKESKQ